MSPAAGARLIGDALDLVHRLPLLWKRVTRLEVPAWQARRVAQQTHALPLIGARWVDHQLAARTDGSLGPVITDRLVALAVAKFDPEAQEQREDNATGRLRREAQPPRPHPLRRHLRPGRHRRHPDVAGLLRPGLRHRPPALARRRHRPPRGPQDQGHRPDHHPGHRPGHAARPSVGPRRRASPRRRPGRSGSPCWSRPTTATSTPRAEPPSRSAACSGSVRPPWPSSASGSATTRSRSSRS